MSASSGFLTGQIADLRKQLRAIQVDVSSKANSVASPYSIAESDKYTNFRNTNGATQVGFALPSASGKEGFECDFVVTDSGGLRVIANGSDTIRSVGTVSGGGGYIESTVVGTVFRLKWFSSTGWVVAFINGTASVV